LSATDDRFAQLVQGRFDEVVERSPTLATYFGLHDLDSKLADGTRDAQLQDIADHKRFITALEALDEADLSAANRFERELALHASRLALFDDEVHRTWERKTGATDEIGDGIFVLFARTARPFAERFEGMAARLEAAPRVLQEQRSRLGEHPQRLWNELELDAAQSLPGLFGEVIEAAKAEFGEDSPEVRRAEKAATVTAAALDDYATWLRDQLGRADDNFALGNDNYEELVRLRAFDGLQTDDILAIGLEQLEFNKQRRREVAAKIDPTSTEEQVLDRIKSDQPHSFNEALDGYRRAMGEARAFVVDHGIASMPTAERLRIIETPEYLRRVMPFAAYFPAAKFEPVRDGIYIVTPSVDGEARAMREHNWGSIYNTSIHEAYPGHHQQMSAALDNPSVVRLLVDAPEFVEGWAMYCEQMMREEGFDTAPERLFVMYTDAIWRATRIILDIRLHRGEIGVADAIAFMVEHTGFERANAEAEVQRYTQTPTYPLSYLLGKVMLLRLRADEQQRLGDKFSLRKFHDALLAGGNIPVSFHRRALMASGNGKSPA
jgi:uncharacterized protein (DUF885 family)